MTSEEQIKEQGDRKNQCQRCGSILEPKKDSGGTLCGFPVIFVPACPRCGWMAKSVESVN